jgi:hypothetical protein
VTDNGKTIKTASSKGGLSSFLTPKTETSLAELYRGADKSLARPGRKQATATENFDFYICYL